MSRFHQLGAYYFVCAITMVCMLATNLLHQSTRHTALHIGKVQINLNLVDENEKQEKPPVFLMTHDSSVYMYSAIARFADVNTTYTTSFTNVTNLNSENQIVISGWEIRGKHNASKFTCCFVLVNGSAKSVTSSSKYRFSIQSKLPAKQYICPVTHELSAINRISLTIKNTTCPNQNKYYLPFTLLKSGKNNANTNISTIAVCTKLAYGSLDARRLVEWFEVHRMFGVDKVLTYTYQLNPMARNVLNYYEELGIVEVLEFDLPHKDVIRRDVGEKNYQSWNDEQIVLFDCQERLQNYDYVAIVDTDEYIVPNINKKNFENAWRTLLEMKFKRPHIAGLRFRVNVHVKTWGPSDPDHPLYIGRYNNCTIPLNDRMKVVYMPSRVQRGSVSTHVIKPLDGYKSETVSSNAATNHHFRGCRVEWMSPKMESIVASDQNYLFYLKNETKCYRDLKRSPSRIMKLISNAVQDRVLHIIKHIRI